MARIETLILCLFAAVTAYSQEIISLPPDPAAVHGVLPNGMSYYIVSDTTMDGMADFALVQKVGAKTIDGFAHEDIIKISQKSLASKPHLLSPTVQDYFASHGVIPRRSGFVNVEDDATVFRFENMMLNSAPSIMDSTLVVLMDMVSEVCTDTEVGGWYSPSDHAVIVAGDVDAGVVAEKIKMLSYMVWASPSFPRREYVWTENEDSKVTVMCDDIRNLAMVSATWRLERTPRALMNTIQPVIYEKYMSELGLVAKKRITAALVAKGVPAADVSYDFVNSINSHGDESFNVSVAVDPSQFQTAVAVLASVMGSIDVAGITIDELTRAEHAYADAVELKYRETNGNAEHVDRCIAAYIYNSSLSSPRDVAFFHSSRVLPDSTNLAIFNSIVSASIDKRRNLELECRIKDEKVSSGIIKADFEAAWDMADASDLVAADTTLRSPVLYGASEKIRIKSYKREHLSGGVVWTLENGFKVIFKDMPADDRVYYSLSLNGGYADMDGLNAGEGAYLSDLLEFSTIGGVNSEDFSAALRKNGMTMDFNVSLSSTVIDGYVSDTGIEYLIRALLTVMNDRKSDPEAFARFMECEPLSMEYAKGGRRERIVSIDSVLCPGYKYTACKRYSGLADDFAVRADKFMQEQASKMNDGVLILVGEVNQAKLRTALQTYGRGFKTKKRSFSRRVVNYQPVSGTMLYTSEGETNSVDMVLSAPLSLTADNYYATSIAAMALRTELSRVVTESGMHLSLYHNCRKYPQERFNVMLSFEEASVDGFLPGTVCMNPVDALNGVRAVFANPADMDISDSELASYKSLLKNVIAERMKTPQYWLNSIRMRYLDGKDFTTGYAAKIDAITPEKVKELISLLGNGTRVEYIINKE